MRRNDPALPPLVQLVLSESGRSETRHMAQAQRIQRPRGEADTIPHPPIVPQSQWLQARKTLLAHEKELTKHYDRIAAERRRLAMVRIEKDYVFEGADGKRDLKSLFEGRRQL